MQFLLGVIIVPTENINNAYTKFKGTNKEYYGIYGKGKTYINYCENPKTVITMQTRFALVMNTLGRICK